MIRRRDVNEELFARPDTFVGATDVELLVAAAALDDGDGVVAPAEDVLAAPDVAVVADGWCDELLLHPHMVTTATAAVAAALNRIGPRM